jgi:hypothetical protein
LAPPGSGNSGSVIFFHGLGSGSRSYLKKRN